MPLVFRAMVRDGDKPAVGPSRDKLGVIPGNPPGGDIPVDAMGTVAPRTGGMSVASAWQKLPVGRIPKRLRSLFPNAAGNNRYYCWYMGGDFEDGPIGEQLMIRKDSVSHALIEPAAAMSYEMFASSLEQTRDDWSIIPEDLP